MSGTSVHGFYRGLAKLAISLLVVGLAGGAAAQGFGVNDDFKAWNDMADINSGQERDFYRAKPNITFTDTDLFTTDNSSDYRMLFPNGTAFGPLFNGSYKKFPQSFSNLAVEGRYHVNDTNATPSTPNASLDVVRDNSNLTGRVFNESQLNLNKDDIVFRYWVNKSVFSPQSVTVNDTGLGGSGNQSVYRVNFSSFSDPPDKYWVGFNKSGYEREFQAAHDDSKSENDFPRINDFVLNSTGATVAVKVRNSSNVTTGTPRTPMDGVEVRIRRRNQGLSGRKPLITVPPTMTNVTTSNGWANFSDVPYGNWSVDITNFTASREKYNGFNRDVPPACPPPPQSCSEDAGTLPGKTYEKTIDATNWVGNVTGDLEGKDTSSFRYAIGAMDPKDGRQFIKMPVTPGSISFTGIPNGSYSFVAARFNLSAQGGPDIGGSSVTVENGKSSTVDLGFPTFIDLNGTVYNSSSSPRESVSNVQVFMFNETDAKFEQASSGSDGTYSARVANSTLYNVTLIPPKGTDYRVTKTQINVNGSAQSNGQTPTYNLSFSKGAVIKGYVETGAGEGLDAEVRIWNGSAKSYGFNRTLDSGYYEINGLDPNQKHRIDVYTSKPGVGDNTSFSITTGSAGNKEPQNFTFGQKNGTLSGNVTDGNGNTIDVELKVLNTDIGLSQTNSSGSNGVYNFTSLPRGTFYRVKAGVGSSYVEQQKQLTLFENTTLDFQLNKRELVDGYVKNASSGNKVGSGFRVVAKNQTQDSIDSDVTNSSGYYNLSLESLNYSVDVIPPGGSDYTENTTSINASSASSGSHDLYVDTGKTLDGFIIQNSTGSVIGDGGELFLWNDTEGIYRSQDIDGSGDYNFTGLKDVGYNLVADSDNKTYEQNTTTVSSSDLGRFDTRLHLNTGRSLAVTVKDNDTEEALSGARVIVGEDQKQTDSSGEAIFPRQTDGGSVTIVVEKQDYTSNSKTVTIESRKSSFGGDSDITEYQNVTVNLDNPAELDVDVNVTRGSASGDPVSNAVVELRANKSGVSHKAGGITGSNGEVRLEGLVEGFSSDYRKGGYLVTLGTPQGDIYTNETELVDDGVVENLTVSNGKYTLMVEVPAE